MTRKALPRSFPARRTPLNAAYLIQLLASAAAVAMMVALAAWATRGRAAPRLDENAARRWLADEFPGRRIDGLWLGADGKGAVARSGDRALVLSRIGSGYVAREVSWAEALTAQLEDGRVRIRLDDVTAPALAIALSAWPPQELAA